MSLCLFTDGGAARVPGLILAAQDESEFAGMLAHAMAHVALKQESLVVSAPRKRRLT